MTAMVFFFLHIVSKEFVQIVCKKVISISVISITCDNLLAQGLHLFHRKSSAVTESIGFTPRTIQLGRTNSGIDKNRTLNRRFTAKQLQVLPKRGTRRPMTQQVKLECHRG